ncbi:interferon-induced protein with tetratricopeptide repeats 5-like [Eublepharis macularius]|uniref:Interferon-induced protein with tetratricopeptide repeats 5-like n=1 Tax=Eublepharis macularius TaxID=481883 RepID=A0AA97JSG3_EUBMA|nr:interferon-induced protein with tetratricopeptide repeats 5-like [Eublepharis macularius]
MSAACFLQTLDAKVQHTGYRNRSIYLAMRAHLQQLQGTYTEALGSLREAETVLREEHPTNFSRHALLIYGNYAWIYYHLSNFEMVELYLGRIHEICRSLSSPEPYSVQIPEIYAQKGWSLLAVSFQYGEEAKKCFQMALQGDKSNRDFQAGLAISIFATWTHSQRSDHWEEAKRLIEKNHRRHPLNDELKVHLASLLEKIDWQRAERLVEEVVRSSLDPEVLRKAAQVCGQSSVSRAISVLQYGLTLAPSYHLLQYDLGVYYKEQAAEAPPGEREEILAAAKESFKRAVEMDPESVFSRLELAQLYIEKDPVYAEEIYYTLKSELPRFSDRCQLAIYLHCGDFLLQRRGLRQEALEMYEAGFTLPGGHHKEWQQLRSRLKALAEVFEEDSKTGCIPSCYSSSLEG